VHGGRILIAVLLAAAFCVSGYILGGQRQRLVASATVFIDANRVEGRISPMLYGQFDEFMFEGVKRGLTAELLRDRGFEQAPNAIGLPRDWERDPDARNDDPVLHVHWDDSVFYSTRMDFIDVPAQHSLRFDLTHDDGQFHGIHQSGVPVRSGITYRGYLWMKTAEFSGHARVALEADRTGGETYASASIENMFLEQNKDWQKYGFTLTPSKSDSLAKFVILFSGKGRLWLDQVSLLPGDAVDGVIRSDVFEKLKALHPAFIRWPGGNVAQDYHWIWGIGPRDQRPIWTNLSWANEPEPGDFGTDEFIRLCRNLGAEPSITVNVEGRGATVAEAAAWVEYANGGASTPQGAVRALNGHAEPFRVKYWEIGNEIWGDWVRGHSDAHTYAQNFNRCAAAMLAVDPGIKLIAVGDNNMEWNRTVLREAGAHIDYLAVHHYYGTREMHDDPLNLLAHPLSYENFYKQLGDAIRELVPGREIKLAINEWNTSLPLPRQHSMESALYAARLMNVFERSDNVAMSAVSDMVNGWSGGVIQASRHNVFVTPTYLVNELYNRRLGTERLGARVESPIFDSSREGNAVPYLDVVASRSVDGRRIFLKAVNTDARRTLRTSIHFSRVRRVASAAIETINAESLSAANSFVTPNAVSLTKRSLAAGTDFVVELPQHSVSVITLQLAK
jgi:alpha-L-arabinofuranosidase